jgi:hypothetical protein
MVLGRKGLVEWKGRKVDDDEGLFYMVEGLWMRDPVKIMRILQGSGKKGRKEWAKSDIGDDIYMHGDSMG